jgi:hypothetical protein
MDIRWMISCGRNHTTYRPQGSFFFRVKGKKKKEFILKFNLFFSVQKRTGGKSEGGLSCLAF